MGEVIKAGLPARMREWMSARTGPFYFCVLCAGLGIPQTSVRYYVYRTLQNFVKRVEIRREVRIHRPGPDHMKKIMSGEIGGDWYFYNHSWSRSTDAPMKKRILRAMRLISFREPFSVADVQGLANAPERSYVDQLIRKLVKQNYLCRIGIQVCPHGVGKESLYRVTDLTRFRLDLL